MIKDKNKQIIDITHCPLFCDVLSHKSIIEKQEIYEDNYYDLQLASYELEKYRKLENQLVLLKKVLDNGIWVKDKDRLYYLDTLEMNVKIEGYGFIIEELYFEDLDCVMDTTGFKVYSQDYKKTWWLKEDKSE